MRIAIGAMTGTSLDGIDIAVAAVEGRGLDMQVRLVRHGSVELGPAAAGLRRAADQEPMTAEAFARLAWSLGERCADAIAATLSECRPDRDVDLVAVHGQTVFHRPPISWQLINPAPIAARLGCRVVFDLRQADLAAGGRGAPITPLADWVLFRHDSTDGAEDTDLARRAIVNLGGFCNVSIVTARLETVAGFDVCACNQVLDAVARAALGAPYDHDGQAARLGTPDGPATEALHTMLDRQRTQRRSLGTGDEAAAWVAAHRDTLSGQDLAATAVAAISRCIALALGDHAVDDIVVAGGGALNTSLVDAIRRAAGPPVSLCSELGVPVQAREALAMAVLGALCADGVPITLPQVTGCREPAPVAGAWYMPDTTAPDKLKRMNSPC